MSRKRLASSADLDPSLQRGDDDRNNYDDKTTTTTDCTNKDEKKNVTTTTTTTTTRECTNTNESKEMEATTNRNKRKRLNSFTSPEDIQSDEVTAGNSCMDASEPVGKEKAPSSSSSSSSFQSETPAASSVTTAALAAHANEKPRSIQKEGGNPLAIENKENEKMEIRKEKGENIAESKIKEEDVHSSLMTELTPTKVEQQGEHKHANAIITVAATKGGDAVTSSCSDGVKGSLSPAITTTIAVATTEANTTSIVNAEIKLEETTAATASADGATATETATKTESTDVSKIDVVAENEDHDTEKIVTTSNVDIADTASDAVVAPTGVDGGKEVPNTNAEDELHKAVVAESTLLGPLPGKDAPVPALTADAMAVSIGNIKEETGACNDQNIASPKDTSAESIPSKDQSTDAAAAVAESTLLGPLQGNVASALPVPALTADATAVSIGNKEEAGACNDLNAAISNANIPESIPSKDQSTDAAAVAAATAAVTEPTTLVATVSSFPPPQQISSTVTVATTTTSPKEAPATTAPKENPIITKSNNDVQTSNIPLPHQSLPPPSMISSSSVVASSDGGIEERTARSTHQGTDGIYESTSAIPPPPPATVSTETVPEVTGGGGGEESSITASISSCTRIVNPNNGADDGAATILDGASILLEGEEGSRERSGTLGDLSLKLGSVCEGGRERSGTAGDLSYIMGGSGEGRDRSGTLGDLSLMMKEGEIGRERSGTLGDLSIIGDGEAASTLATAALGAAGAGSINHHPDPDHQYLVGGRPRANSTCTIDSKNLHLMGIVATGEAAEAIIKNSRPRRLSFDLPPLGSGGEDDHSSSARHHKASFDLSFLHDAEAKQKVTKHNKGPPRKRSFDLPLADDYLESVKASSSTSRQRKSSFDLSLLHDVEQHCHADHDSDAGLIAAAATVASLGSSAGAATDPAWAATIGPKQSKNVVVTGAPRDDESHVSEDTVGAAIKAVAAAFDGGGSGNQGEKAGAVTTTAALEGGGGKKVGTALDHLDALGASENGASSNKSDDHDEDDKEDEKAVAMVRSAAKALGDDNSSSSGGATLDPVNHRLLVEALMGGNSTAGGTAQGGAPGEFDSEGIRQIRQRRQRFESWGGMSDLSVAGIGGGGGADVGSLGSDAGSDPVAAAAVAASALQHTGIIDDVTGAAEACESILGSLGSLPDEPIGAEDSCASPAAAAAAAAAAAVAAAATATAPLYIQAPSHPSHVHDIYGAAPSPRNRLDSLASLSEASMSFGTTVAPSTSRSRSNSHAATDLADMNSIVAAAMATVSDQIAEIACAVEASAEIMATSAMTSKPRSGKKNKKKKAEESLSSTATTTTNTPSKPPISVDYDAVAAAVTAATSSAIDISSIAGMSFPSSPSPAMVGHTGITDETPIMKNTAASRQKRPHYTSPQSIKSATVSSSCATPSKPPATGPIHYPTTPLPPPSTASSKDMEAIRARARAAAGYVPPSGGTPAPAAVSGRSSITTPSPRQPIKKRGKRASPGPQPAGGWTASSPDSSQLVSSAIVGAGPRASSAPAPSSYSATTSVASKPPSMPPSVISAPPRRSASATTSKGGGGGGGGGGGQSNQKWDDMLECLIKYKEEQRELLTKGLSEKEKAEWEWDGNVPTTYKTSSGKALGRWINNQRSAKSKGSLKREREVRLVGTGLKWSVLSTNAWPDMMQELRLYVKEKTKDGKPWDGNVPTNYRIKGNTAPDGTEIDEDKNLGRWINRQRSLFQAGKLKKHRQIELEKIGLKWSVLSTTSWQVMYEALCEYADTRKKEDPSQKWDGNVPANYKTPDNPQKSLGRWVNRQRSAYAKNRLKQEFVEKLEKIGLRWSVHEKKLNSKACSESTKGSKTGRNSPVSSAQANGDTNAKCPPKKGAKAGKTVVGSGGTLAQQSAASLQPNIKQEDQPIVKSNPALAQPKTDVPMTVKTES